MQTYYFSILGRLLRQQRKEANLTLEQLEAMSGVVQDQISKIGSATENWTEKIG